MPSIAGVDVTKTVVRPIVGVIIGPVWPEETGKDEIGTVVPEWIVIRPEGEGEDVTKGEGPEHGSGPEEPMVMVEPMSSEPSAPKLIMGEMAIAESIMHMIGGELVIGGELAMLVRDMSEMLLVIGKVMPP